jgi:hypothetical protein
MTLIIITIIIAVIILLYGAYCYIDKIVTDRHDEMMRGYACHMGLTDEEIKEIEEK